MAKKTPPIRARGRYVLIAPWDSLIVSTKLYSCMAIRTFKDIYDDGIDVEEEYYTPRGLIDGELYAGDVFHFSDEKDAQANIITLIADDGQTIHVPDTYIASFPNMGEVKYSHLVLSFDFGAVPDYLDFSALRTMMSNMAGKSLGIIPTSVEHRAPSANAPTPLEHDALEVARVAAIENQESDYARAERVEAEKLQLIATNAKLTEILTANGWLPT